MVTDRPWPLNLTNRGPTECSSITAEISPHHRPIDWDLLGRMTGTPAAQKLVKAQQKLADEDLQRPLRIRGHLFFDASHGLWKGNEPTTGNPPRRSGWEIHARLQHRGVRLQDIGDLQVRSGGCLYAVDRLAVVE